MMDAPAGHIDPATDSLVPPSEILDEDGLRAEIMALWSADNDEKKFRLAVAKLLRAAKESGAEKIRERFVAVEEGGLRAARSVAALTDACVRLIFAAAADCIHAAGSASEREALTVVAVGGYGRAEMAPYSDVDLLFLIPEKSTAWAGNVVETMLYFLWDIGMKPGHAVRDADACIRLARDDMTIRTTLLEMRLVCGAAGQLDELNKRTTEELFRKGRKDFIAAKLEERDERHEAAGGSRYLLNPDLKDGKGGLRDLQTLHWMARCMFGPVSRAGLLQLGIFEPDESVALAMAERTLWTFRFHLHYSAGRPENRLHFEHQVQIAEALGYQEGQGLRPVELFMRDYYRIAREVGELTRIFCAGLEQQDKKDRPGVGSLLSRFWGPRDSTAELNGFPVENGRITLASAEAIDEDPTLILRLFRTSLEHDAHIHPDAYRRIVQNAHLIGDQVRADSAANQEFMAVLTAHKNPARTLRRMVETGVLGLFLPDFGHVVGLMQFDTYHYYTVDEHTLLALDTLARIEAGELAAEHPLATELFGKIEQRDALYVALLMHDIGKGLGGDHSELGAEIATRLCPRLGMNEADTETVVWLVRNHLVMFRTAQRRDLADPATAREFAEVVQERERLALLLILTVCDIKSVSPEYWNDWKAQLLRDLYNGTLSRITEGEDMRPTDESVVQAKAALQERLSGEPGTAVEELMEALPPPFWFSFDVDTHETLARLALSHTGEGSSVKLERDEVRGATKICVYTEYRGTLLAETAEAIAAAGASVVGVRTFTTKNGMAVLVFWVHNEQGAAHTDPGDFERIEAKLKSGVQRGEVSQSAKPRRAIGSPVPVRVRIENDASDLYTLVEVTAPDRPGLLADLAHAINDANAQISATVISTYGERAVDSFYVKDSFGLKVTKPAAVQAIEEQVRQAAAADGTQAEAA